MARTKSVIHFSVASLTLSVEFRFLVLHYLISVSFLFPNNLQHIHKQIHMFLMNAHFCVGPGTCENLCSHTHSLNNVRCVSLCSFSTSSPSWLSRLNSQWMLVEIVIMCGVSSLCFNILFPGLALNLEDYVWQSEVNNKIYFSYFMSGL